MAFKHLIEKTKDAMKVVKNKAADVIEKGNSEIKKLVNTTDVFFINSPVIGSFETKKAFYEEGYLLFPVKEHKEELFVINNVIKLKDDDNYYVIKDIILEPVTKTINKEDKEYTYECYKVVYSDLTTEFENDIKDLKLYALTVEQEDLLNELIEKIKEKKVFLNGKKDTCLDMWSYFVKCIQYKLKNYYLVMLFSKLADEVVDGFSAYLLKLF